MNRGLRISRALAAAIVLSIGSITLLGLLVGDDLGALSLVVSAPIANGPSLRGYAFLFLRLSTIILALTILIGIVNLIVVHARRITRRERGLVYSLIILLSFLGTLIAFAVDRQTGLLLLEEVQVAIESSLASLVFVALVYGAFRMMHRRVTLVRTLFVVSMIVVLVGALPLGEAVINDFSDLWLRLPVSAGARGILLGIALATLVAGIRVLIGQDRSYRD